MPITKEETTITFSGGGTNTDPDSSIGGIPSVQPVTSSRLFDDVSESERAAGTTDYRCVYFNNESSTETLFATKISSEFSENSEVKLGFDFKNERQSIAITNAIAVTGGNVTLIYTDIDGDHDVMFAYNSSIATWAGNLQYSIHAITNLTNVLVTGSISGNNALFEIDFVGDAANRYHETILLKPGGNGLTTSSGTTSIAVTKTISGSPLNQLVDSIDVDTTVPNGVSFYEEVMVGDIRPLDTLPIWIRRVVPIGGFGVENDGFNLKIVGRPYSN